LFTRAILIGLLSLLPVARAAEPPPELIAVVDLRYIKKTNIVATTVCYGEECFPWSDHYLWEAKIRKVLKGTRPKGRVLVLHGRHALLKRDLKDLVVALEPIDPKNNLGASYKVTQVAGRLNLACFPDETGLPTNRVIEPGRGESNCIDVDALPEEVSK
jgi:hypothetical protein